MLVAMLVLVHSVNPFFIDNFINKCIAITAALDAILVEFANAQSTATAFILNDIYNDSEDDLLATTLSIQALDSILQVLQVLRLQAKPSSWSWVFALLELQLADRKTWSSWTAWQLQTIKAEHSADVLRVANSLRMVATSTVDKYGP